MDKHIINRVAGLMDGSAKLQGGLTRPQAITAAHQALTEWRKPYPSDEEQIQATVAYAAAGLAELERRRHVKLLPPDAHMPPEFEKLRQMPALWKRPRWTRQATLGRLSMEAVTGVRASKPEKRPVPTVAEVQATEVVRLRAEMTGMPGAHMRHAQHCLIAPNGGLRPLADVLAIDPQFNVALWAKASQIVKLRAARTHPVR